MPFRLNFETCFSHSRNFSRRAQEWRVFLGHLTVWPLYFQNQLAGPVLWKPRYLVCNQFLVFVYIIDIIC